MSEVGTNIPITSLIRNPSGISGISIIKNDQTSLNELSKKLDEILRGKGEGGDR